MLIHILCLLPFRQTVKRTEFERTLRPQSTVIFPLTATYQHNLFLLQRFCCLLMTCYICVDIETIVFYFSISKLLLKLVYTIINSIVLANNQCFFL